MFERCRRENFDNLHLHNAFTLIFERRRRKNTTYTTYTSELHCFSSAAGEKFLQFKPPTQGIYIDFGAPQAKIFGNLNRLHKGFTLILERRRRENFDNLQENFENCRTFKPLF